MPFSLPDSTNMTFNPPPSGLGNVLAGAQGRQDLTKSQLANQATATNLRTLNALNEARINHYNQQNSMLQQQAQQQYQGNALASETFGANLSKAQSEATHQAMMARLLPGSQPLMNNGQIVGNTSTGLYQSGPPVYGNSASFGYQAPVAPGGGSFTPSNSLLPPPPGTQSSPNIRALQGMTPDQVMQGDAMSPVQQQQMQQQVLQQQVGQQPQYQQPLQQVNPTEVDQRSSGATMPMTTGQAAKASETVEALNTLGPQFAVLRNAYSGQNTLFPGIKLGVEGVIAKFGGPELPEFKAAQAVGNAINQTSDQLNRAYQGTNTQKIILNMKNSLMPNANETAQGYQDRIKNAQALLEDFKNRIQWMHDNGIPRNKSTTDRMQTESFDPKLYYGIAVREPRLYKELSADFTQGQRDKIKAEHLRIKSSNRQGGQNAATSG